MNSPPVGPGCAESISVPGFGVVAPRGPRLIHAAILLFTAGLSSLATAVLGPTLPKMQQHFATAPHANYLVPVSLTVPMLMMALLSVFCGLMADRLGRKRILIWATVSYALCGTAPLWLGSLNSILASRVLLGVAEATVMTVSTTLIGDYFFGALRAKMMALHTTFAAVSAFVWNIVGGVLGNSGWRAPYMVYGISLALSVPMAIYLWEPTGSVNKEVGNFADGAPFSARRSLGLCLVAVVVGLVFLTVPVHLGYLFAQLQVTSSAQIGYAYALNSLGVIVGSLSFGWLIGPRIRSVALQLALAAGVLALSMVGMAASTGAAGLTIAATVNGLGMGLVLPAVVTWNMRELPFSRRGVGVGAFQSSLFLGMFCNPILVVGLDQWTGGRATAVGWMGIAVLLAAGTCGFIGFRTRYAVTPSLTDA